jgi:Ankyrin repeats (3 copies)
MPRQVSQLLAYLLYISFDAFAGSFCRSDEELEARLHKYPLLKYAAQHWGGHARGSPEEAIKELALKFLKDNSKLMCASQVMHLPEYRYPGYSQCFQTYITGFHITTSFDLAEIMQQLLSHEGVDADSRNFYGQTPLSWAAMSGYEIAVQLLLSHRGIDVNSRDECGLTPLSWAARYGHERVSQLLLWRRNLSWRGLA